MKIYLCLLIIAATLTCCKSRKGMVNSAYVATDPVEIAVVEKTQEEEVVEAPVTIKQEEVVRTHGNDLMRYCVIVGSFVNEQNATNLRAKLMEMGFTNTSIMRNNEGMYRVSAVCDETEADAREELSQIRTEYSQFRDAWLLMVKDKK